MNAPRRRSQPAESVESWNFNVWVMQKLESGSVDLEESISLYERGAALKAHCEAKLKAAQERIEKIVVSSDGRPKTEPAAFD